MSPNEAKLIIEDLANGIDPDTREVLADPTIFNRPKIIRALFIAAKMLDKLSTENKKFGEIDDLSKKVKREKTRTINTGNPWSNKEDNQLLSSFDGGIPVKNIAENHGRTIGAISARLVRLGRIDKRKDVYLKT